MKACIIISGQNFPKSTHKKALKNVSTFNFPIFTFVSAVFCSCGKCPDIPTDIEKSAVWEKWLEGVSGAIDSAQRVRKA